MSTMSTETENRRLDMELEQTFPASDPIPWIHELRVHEMSVTRQDKLYLDDFAVGQRFTSGTVVVTADEIKSFAARFDPQPFHLDEAAAKQSIFGGLVASGWHTAAMAMRLLVDSDLRIVGGLIGLGGEMTWPRATKPGDVLHVESEVLEVTPSRSKPDSGIVKMRNTTLNQHGDAVQIAVVNMLVPRKPA
jgi:acyl dehydratase